MWNFVYIYTFLKKLDFISKLSHYFVSKIVKEWGQGYIPKFTAIVHNLIKIAITDY